MLNALIAHGGGPTAVLNSSLAGLIDGSRGRFSSLTAAHYGLGGNFAGDLLQLPPAQVTAIAGTPGSAIGSSRRPPDFDRVISELRRLDIRVVFHTGGNGSMQAGLDLLSAARHAGFELQVIGIPKTIDNDLPVTHHTPGYASTAYFFACAARDAGADCRSLPSPICILETLGRNAGWIVAATSLARKDADDPPHLIYFPERRLALDRIAADVEAVYKRLGYVVVSVCEGQLDETGTPFGADVDRPDNPHHRLASNLGHALAQRLTALLGLRARSERPGLIGRSCGLFARERDRRDAYSVGVAAAVAAAEGHNGVMVALDSEGGTFPTPLESVAGHERLFPEEWIAESGNDVTDDFADYGIPLIGEVARYERLRF